MTISPLPATIIHVVPSLNEQNNLDAAISLCEMGSKQHYREPLSSPNRVPSSPINDQRPQDMLASIAAAEDDDDQQSIRTSDGSTPITCKLYTQRTPNKRLPPKKRVMKRQNGCKRKDPRVSFEEMKRLMRVYGPTKCLRNRTPIESGKCTKILSVKRKFYRWFPDFHKRFELQPCGAWYKPIIGHEAEMKYREDLRTKDQELLAAKRNAKSLVVLRMSCAKSSGCLVNNMK